MNDEIESTAQDSGRRDFLKKSLVAGAVMWSAPVVTSLPGGRAWAQTYCPPGGVCTVNAFGLHVFSNALTVDLLLPNPGVDCVANPDFGSLTGGIVTGNAATICGVTDPALCTAEGRIEGLTLTVAGITVTADILVGTASLSGECPPCEATGSGTLLNVTVAGIPVTINPAQCTVVPVPLLGEIRINEQFCANGVLNVNALHVILTVPNPLGTPIDIDIRAGHAEAGREGCDCSPAAPCP